MSVVLTFRCDGCGERRCFTFVPPVGPSRWLAVRGEQWENILHLCPTCQTCQLSDALLRTLESAVGREEQRAA